MWRPVSITCRQSIEKTLLLPLPAYKVCLPTRNTNDGNIESRYGKSKSGWFTRKGTKAGYPPSWPHQSRVVGIDLNLQVRNLVVHIFCIKIVVSIEEGKSHVKITKSTLTFSGAP